MRSFDYIESGKTLLTPHTTSLLAAIHEAKGRQSIQTTIRPDILGTLVAVARIQSTDASNRIEGISTSDSRLNDLVSEKVTPRNRNEEEIAGYRDALSVIHESHDYIPITPNVILQLHRDLFRHTPLTFAGHFKDSDNVIIERDAHGTSTVRFAPPSALATPELIERACSAYTQAIRDGHTDPLLAIAMFILDFTCIHPFNDGNGRMSRLLTLLLLYRAGYPVGKYVSLEMIIERSKETYYEALQASSQGWHEENNTYVPFVKYSLGVVLNAYREFTERVKHVQNNGLSKSERVRAMFDEKLGKLTKKEIAAACPDISLATIEAALGDLVKSGYIQKVGAGKKTGYVRCIS